MNSCTGLPASKNVLCNSVSGSSVLSIPPAMHHASRAPPGREPCTNLAHRAMTVIVASPDEDFPHCSHRFGSCRSDSMPLARGPLAHQCASMRRGTVVAVICQPVSAYEASPAALPGGACWQVAASGLARPLVERNPRT